MVTQKNFKVIVVIVTVIIEIVVIVTVVIVTVLGKALEGPLCGESNLVRVHPGLVSGERVHGICGCGVHNSC